MALRKALHNGTLRDWIVSGLIEREDEKYETGEGIDQEDQANSEPSASAMLSQALKPAQQRCNTAIGQRAEPDTQWRRCNS